MYMYMYIYLTYSIHLVCFDQLFIEEASPPEIEFIRQRKLKRGQRLKSECVIAKYNPKNVSYKRANGTTSNTTSIFFKELCSIFN